ncbi:MAG: hypothetical protein M1818_005275 [Claussenomyces sp. TS43310]|nr:MAG: hypothetical protein M1818_005275 [Claussenomyces sp. TS43310]
MDASSPAALLMAILPKVPMMGKTALSHTLGLSETAKLWDLRTELTVNVIRSLISQKPKSVSISQDISKKAPAPKGNIWISKVCLQVPQDASVSQSLTSAIESLKGDGDAPGGYIEPDLLPVEAEWTGYRSGAGNNTTEPPISEKEKYDELMREATSPVTILYFHGGAYYLMDPATHRPTCLKLARLTKGRCLNVRYRLAPQYPFPSALLDALIAYFNLLYPLPGSFHKPVSPTNIVICGDSAGGNLSTVLIQTLLEFRRRNLKIKWGGEEREVPLPAGAGLNSPWMDITQCMPSCELNGMTDYLPPPSVHPDGMEFPPCPIWPASPPRKNMYAEDSILCHPLVSPIAATNWEGSCPFFIATGGELLTDEDKHVAMTIAQRGAPVVFYEFEAMPHCFALLLDGMAAAEICFNAWTKFITDAVTDQTKIETTGIRIKPRTLEHEPIDVKRLSPFTHKEITKMMSERMQMLSEKQPDTLTKR